MLDRDSSDGVRCKWIDMILYEETAFIVLQVGTRHLGAATSIPYGKHQHSQVCQSATTCLYFLDVSIMSEQLRERTEE